MHVLNQAQLLDYYQSTLVQIATQTRLQISIVSEQLRFWSRLLLLMSPILLGT